MSNDNLPVYIECGSCGHYHPVEFFGDCRDDANRFTQDQLDAKHPKGWKEQIFSIDYKHCDTEWTQEWSCACDDKCPKCDKDIEAHDWTDISILHGAYPARSY